MTIFIATWKTTKRGSAASPSSFFIHRSIPSHHWGSLQKGEAYTLLSKANNFSTLYSKPDDQVVGFILSLRISPIYYEEQDQHRIDS